MKVTITLGVSFAHYQAPVEINSLLHTDVGEIDPDVFYDSLQRIGGRSPEDNHAQCDLDRIAARYGSDNGYHSSLAVTLTHLRRLMERRGAPSMSVGDTIDIWSPADENLNRIPIVRHTCERMGWTHGPIPTEIGA